MCMSRSTTIKSSKYVFHRVLSINRAHKLKPISKYLLQCFKPKKKNKKI